MAQRDLEDHVTQLSDFREGRRGLEMVNDSSKYISKVACMIILIHIVAHTHTSGCIYLRFAYKILLSLTINEK